MNNEFRESAKKLLVDLSGLLGKEEGEPLAVALQPDPAKPVVSIDISNKTLAEIEVLVIQELLKTGKTRREVSIMLDIGERTIYRKLDGGKTYARERVSAHKKRLKS